MSASYRYVASRFWILLALVVVMSSLLSGCATEPWDKAAQEMDRAAFDQLIDSAKDRQAARNETLSIALYYAGRGEKYRSFHAKLYKDMLAAGANPKENLTSILTSGSVSPSNIDLLKETGFDLDSSDDRGVTLLGLAVSAGNVETVRRLISYRVKMNRASITKETPLGEAVSNWTMRSTGSPTQRQFLDRSIKNGEIIARMLIDAGANVDVRSGSDDRTPAMDAALQNRPDVVNYLISRGANPRLKNRDGYDVPALLAYSQGLEQEKSRQAAEKAQVSAANRRDLLNLGVTVGGAAALGNSMQGSSYTDAQRSAVVDAWVQDNANRMKGQSTNNLVVAVDAVKPQPRPTPAINGKGGSQGTGADPSGNSAGKPELWNDEYSNQVISTGQSKSFPDHERNIPGDVIRLRVGSMAAASSVWAAEGGSVTSYAGCGDCKVGSTIVVVVRFQNIIDTHVYRRMQ